MRIISVSRDRGWKSRLNSPAGSKLSFTIQDYLKKTPIGNEWMVNHTAIHFGDMVYEIHGNGLRKIRFDEYLAQPHKTFYFFRYKNMENFDYENLREFIEYVWKHQNKGNVKYDALLLFRIWWHIKKDGLENLSTCMKDLTFICSEFAQICIEAGLHHNISNRVMLPNDFHCSDSFVEEDIDGKVLS